MFFEILPPYWDTVSYNFLTTKNLQWHQNAEEPDLKTYLKHQIVKNIKIIYLYFFKFLISLLPTTLLPVETANVRETLQTIIQDFTVLVIKAASESGPVLISGRDLVKNLKRGWRKKSWPEESVAEFCQKWQISGRRKCSKEFLILQ